MKMSSQCPIGEEISKSEQNLEKHIAFVNECKKAFKGDINSKPSTQNASLKLKIKGNKKPFECSKCRTRFNHGGSLKKHKCTW